MRYAHMYGWIVCESACVCRCVWRFDLHCFPHQFFEPGSFSQPQSSLMQSEEPQLPSPETRITGKLPHPPGIFCGFQHCSSGLCGKHFYHPAISWASAEHFFFYFCWFCFLICSLCYFFYELPFMAAAIFLWGYCVYIHLWNIESINLLCMLYAEV